MNSPSLRQTLRERRRAVPAIMRVAAADGLALQLLALEAAPRSGYVAGYWAVDGEAPLHAWQLRLPRECVYCLPVLAGEVLKFAPFRPGDAVQANRFGIPEPVLAQTSLLDARDLAMIVLPLTGFDAQCHRLGMGGGWYDRTLAFRAASTAPPLLVGAGFDVQQVDQLEPAAWDIRCDAICTPTTTHLRSHA